VIACYILGMLWLLILIPFYLYLRSVLCFFQEKDSHGAATLVDEA